MRGPERPGLNGNQVLVPEKVCTLYDYLDASWGSETAIILFRGNLETVAFFVDVEDHWILQEARR